MQNSGPVKAILLSEFDAAIINPAQFLPINGPAGLDQACFFLRIANNSNVAIIISYDGVNDNEFLRANESINLDVYPNNFRKGIRVYVSGAAAGIGTITLSGYYVGA